MTAQPVASRRGEAADEISGSDPITASAARATLIRLGAAGFAAYCSYAICRTPLLPLFARDLGAGPSLVGLVMGASTLTGVFVKLPAGALSDRFGRRRLLLAGALVFATLPFTYLVVSTVSGLIALRFLHGSATATFGPVVAAASHKEQPHAVHHRVHRAGGAWRHDHRVRSNSHDEFHR
jgi:MFS family permease